MTDADLFDLAPCGLAVLGKDGRILRVNRRLCEWTGFAPEELPGCKRFPELIADGGGLFFQSLVETLDRDGAVDEVFALLLRRDGDVAPVYLSAVLRGADGRAPSIHVSFLRGERRAEYEAELRRGKRAAEQLAAIVANSSDAIVSVDPGGVILNANRAFSEIFQIPPEEVVGANLAELVVPRQFRAQYDEKLRNALIAPEKGKVVRRQRRDGTMLDFSLSTAPIRDETGHVVAISAIYRDVTPMMRAAEHIEFLLREVNHRSKNMLAVVQAVARQTARLAATPELFIDGFMARLSAIASSHDLLVSRDWRGVQIADLTRSQLGQLDQETRDRIFISGDYLEINPRAAEAFGLALHELATNAVKHGALSTPKGGVALGFRLDAEAKIYTLTWQESGGPLVTAPMRAGFGGAVLTRMAPLAIQGKSSLDFEPDGLSYRLSAPLAQIVMGG